MASEKQVKNLEWESEVLQQRFTKVQSERDELYDKFESSIYEVAQKTGLKGTLLERRLEAMSEALEMKEAQLAEVLTAANLDPGTLQVRLRIKFSQKIYSYCISLVLASTSHLFTRMLFCDRSNLNSCH